MRPGGKAVGVWAHGDGRQGRRAAGKTWELVGEDCSGDQAHRSSGGTWPRSGWQWPVFLSVGACLVLHRGIPVQPVIGLVRRALMMNEGQSWWEEEAVQANGSRLAGDELRKRRALGGTRALGALHIGCGG